MKTILYLAPANSIHSWRWISSFKEKGFQIVWVSLHKYDQTMSQEYRDIKPKCFYRSSSFFINILVIGFMFLLCPRNRFIHTTGLYLVGSPYIEE